MSDDVGEGGTIERIELRPPGGPLLGVLVVERALGLTTDGSLLTVLRDARLEVKRGQRLFHVDLLRRLTESAAELVERTHDPDAPTGADQGMGGHSNPTYRIVYSALNYR